MQDTVMLMVLIQVKERIDQRTILKLDNNTLNNTDFLSNTLKPMINPKYRLSQWSNGKRNISKSKYFENDFQISLTASYFQVFKAFIDPDTPTSISDSSYDAILCCAGFFQVIRLDKVFIEGYLWRVVVLVGGI